MTTNTIEAATNSMLEKHSTAKLYESLALKGDLSGLNPAEKVAYYKSLCERLGLDPSTQPFLPLKLNGREILYASRACTDQLARLHSVNRRIIDRQDVAGVYIVTCEASLPNGRSEQSTGAVSIGGLKADFLANALMKAETKSKRRATLSLLGLGMLDESEIETIPQATEYGRYNRPTKAQLVENLQTRSISGICKDLKKAGDEVDWNRTTLLEYAQALFTGEFLGNSIEDLTLKQKQFLAEDLDDRLKSLQKDEVAEREAIEEEN